MSTIKFYKDSNGAFRLTDCTGKLAYINKGDIVSAYAENGVCSMIFSDEVYNRFTNIHNKNTAITDFVNASSVAYNEAGLNAVLSDFFIVNTNVDFGSLIAAVQSSGGSQFKAFTVEITRPANTTVYTANDVIADVTATFIPFLNVAKAIGAGIKIVRVRVQTEDTGVAGKKFNLHLYREAPTFIADNAAFAINYTNASKRIGAIPVVMGAGNLGTVGMNDYNQLIINPVARDVYFILETVDGFTPSANSTRFQITIDCELSN